MEGSAFDFSVSVQKMATGKSDDQFIQIGNKLKLGPKVENSELAMVAW